MKGGGSSLGKSPVYPVWVENLFDCPQDTSNLVVGVESCVPIAIMEVASSNGPSSEVVHMVQLATAPQPRIFPNLPCIEEWFLDELGCKCYKFMSRSSLSFDIQMGSSPRCLVLLPVPPGLLSSSLIRT